MIQILPQILLLQILAILRLFDAVWKKEASAAKESLTTIFGNRECVRSNQFPIP